MAFETALIVYFESDAEPTLVHDSWFLALVPANSSRLLLMLFNSACVGLAYHFTLCICVSLMMLLNRRGHSTATVNPASIHRHASQSVIRRPTSNTASPASLLLVDHLLVHLLSLELLLAGDGVLELLDVLVQELFLRLLLLLQVVALLCDLLHHGVRFFYRGHGFKVRDNPRVLVHLA